MIAADEQTAAVASCSAVAHEAAKVRRPSTLEWTGMTADGKVRLRCARCGADVTATSQEVVDSARPRPLLQVVPAPTPAEQKLAEAVRRIAQTVEVMARNGHYRLELPDGFALDVARNATMALIDLLEPES